MGCAKVSLRDDSHLLHVCEQHALVSHVCCGASLACVLERHAGSCSGEGEDQKALEGTRLRDACSAGALLPAAPVSSIDFQLFEYNV